MFARYFHIGNIHNLASEFSQICMICFFYQTILTIIISKTYLVNTLVLREGPLIKAIIYYMVGIFVNNMFCFCILFNIEFIPIHMVFSNIQNGTAGSM